MILLTVVEKLALAAKKGNIVAVRKLLEEDVDVNSVYEVSEEKE